MSRVYEDDNFRGRVDHAAKVIARGGDANRTFDTCFEMHDGDAVAVALYRRVTKNPNTSLARNIWRYLSFDSVAPMARKYSNRNLDELAREQREKGRRDFEEFMKKVRAENE